jgi:hypothetical protein
MKLTMRNLRRIIREQLEDEMALPKQEWVLLQAGDPRRDAIQQQLFDMVTDAYADKGGHPKISSPGSLNKYTYWIVEDLDDDPEVDVAMLGKPKPGGNKLGAAATDGTGPAKAAYKEKSAELRKGGSVGGVGNWWGEVSGVPAYASLSRGAPAIEDEATVRALLPGKPVIWHGMHPDEDAAPLFKAHPGWYTRTDIGHTKIIVGNPDI